jgi:phage tail sheath protein FI
VYIEEVPSSVRTIGRVSTSIAAFAGWAKRGPAGRPVRCLSWSDYDRIFGGFDGRSYLGYALSHFFGNGGSEAYVVRIAAPGDKVATAVVDGLEVEATGPGAWANDYQLVTKPRADDNSRFRLDIVVKASGAVLESYMNLSLDPVDSRFVTNVLGEESQFVAVTKADVTKKVTAKTEDLAGGVNGDVIRPGDAAFDTALMGDGVATGVFSLAKVDLFNLLNVPGYANSANLAKLQKFCRDERALLIVDSEAGSTPTSTAMTGAPNGTLTGADGVNAAFYYPWLLAPDPEQQYRIRSFPPGGAVAGVYARTDATRGVWKAPAGTDASLSGVVGVTIPMNDAENGWAEPARGKLHSQVPGLRHGRLGRPHAAGQRRDRLRVEVRARPAHGALHRGEPLPWSQVGGLRAQ